MSDPTTIGAGETLELTSAYSGQLTFAADRGTLELDNAASFSGTVAGMAGQDHKCRRYRSDEGAGAELFR